MARKQVFLIFLMPSLRLELQTLASYTVLMLSTTDLKSMKQSSGISQSKNMKEFSFVFKLGMTVHIILGVSKKRKEKKANIMKNIFLL